MLRCLSLVIDKTYILTRFGALLLEIPPILQQTAEAIDRDANNIDNVADVNKFIQENKTGMIPFKKYCISLLSRLMQELRHRPQLSINPMKLHLALLLLPLIIKLFLLLISVLLQQKLSCVSRKRYVFHFSCLFNFR